MPHVEPKEETIAIRTRYITLGQLLKYADLIDEGAMAKPYLAEGRALVNGETETRRGRKLYPGDTVLAEGRLIHLVPEEGE